MNLSFKEDHISQIPALMLLEKLGYTYLTPKEALEMREGSTANVLLEPILRQQLEEINTVQVSSSKTAMFTAQNIANGIEALRNLPMDEGYISANQTAYALLTAGKFRGRARPFSGWRQKRLYAPIYRLETPRKQRVPRYRGVCREPNRHHGYLSARYRIVRQRNTTLRH